MVLFRLARMKATDAAPAMAEMTAAKPMKGVAKLSALAGEIVPPTAPQPGAKARNTEVE